MMYWIIFPLAGAVTGLLAGLIVYSFFLRKLEKTWSGNSGSSITRSIASYASSMAKDMVGSRISDPGNFAKMLPAVEQHIDTFLLVKLPEQMPVLKMFIGSKTTDTLKAIFLKELESLFPGLMAGYAEKMSGPELEEMIYNKLASIDIKSIINERVPSLKLYTISILAATGFLTGIINSVLLCLI